jgi:hypothetical protein
MATIWICEPGWKTTSTGLLLLSRRAAQIGMMAPQGRTLLTVAQAEQQFVSQQEWRRFSVKTGTKGPLLFEWACLPILHHWEDDGQHWLLIRRIPTQPTEKT